MSCLFFKFGSVLNVVPKTQQKDNLWRSQFQVSFEDCDWKGIRNDQKQSTYGDLLRFSEKYFLDGTSTHNLFSVCHDWL